MSYSARYPTAPPVSDRLDLLWLRATLAAAASGPLPTALGPTFHGALGRALKLVACALPRPLEQICPGCAMLDRCPYPRLAEPRRHRWSGQIPPAALITAPFGSVPRALNLGAVLNLDLTLVGHAVHALPVLLSGLALVARDGIGPGRVQCAVVRVDALDASGQPLAAVQVGGELTGTAPVISAAAWQTRGARGGGRTSLRVAIGSPLCLQRDGAIDTRPPSFAELIRALARRSDALARAYCGEESPFPDPRPWLSAAESVRIDDSQLHWERRQRRSASTGQVMPLEGMTGWIDYAAPAAVLEPFFPLLFLGEALGVGRGCAFGNGRYRIHLPRQGKPTDRDTARESKHGSSLQGNAAPERALPVKP